MSDKQSAAKLEQGSHLPGDADRDFKSFADEGYDPGEVVPGGYDPGKVVKGSLREELIRVASNLPKGSEDRLALISLINGGDPGSRMVEARVAAVKEAKLREDTIKLAHSLPKGSPERKALITTLKEAGCEKLPKALQQNCEDMKAGKEPGKGKSDDKKDDKKKDDGKMPADLLEKFKSKKKAADKPIGKGRNGYIAMYKNKRVEVMANTQHEAETIAAKHLGARRNYEVSVILAEQNGKQVTHLPLFASDKKAALVRLAKTMEKGSAERKAILELAAGCEKLPEGGMRDNCEKKVEEGKKKDEKEEK
jgi:hypothetical protein